MKTNIYQCFCHLGAMQITLNFLLLVAGFSAVFVDCQTTEQPPFVREYLARRYARQCIFQNGLTYATAIELSNGEFKDESHKVKCFVKCFAYKIGFFNADGELQKTELLKYVHYILPSKDVAEAVIDKCSATLKPEEDLCDYVYEAYKCFWTQKSQQIERAAVENSIYHLFGFDRLSDEEETR